MLKKLENLSFFKGLVPSVDEFVSCEQQKNIFLLLYCLHYHLAIIGINIVCKFWLLLEESDISVRCWRNRSSELFSLFQTFLGNRSMPNDLWKKERNRLSKKKSRNQFFFYWEHNNLIFGLHLLLKIVGLFLAVWTIFGHKSYRLFHFADLVNLQHHLESLEWRQSLVISQLLLFYSITNNYFNVFNKSI